MNQEELDQWYKRNKERSETGLFIAKTALALTVLGIFVDYKHVRSDYKELQQEHTALTELVDTYAWHRNGTHTATRTDGIGYRETHVDLTGDGKPDVMFYGTNGGDGVMVLRPYIEGLLSEHNQKHVQIVDSLDSRLED